MATARIFISHAGADSETARMVSDALRAHGLETLWDRDTLRAGDAFVRFMDDALATSDYCLLLWSVRAAEREWVREEWQAALHRSVTESRAFLCIGCLDEHRLPALLAPRLSVPLHPALEPGLSTIVEAWQNDRRAEKESDRPVASSKDCRPTDAGGDAIYITSDLFGITCPWSADLQAPAGVLLDQLRRDLKLPTGFDHDSRIGARFEYHLASNEQRLERGATLAAQGVARSAVVWLECDVNLVASANPITGTLGKATFRSSADGDARRAVRQYLLSAIDRIGFSPP